MTKRGLSSDTTSRSGKALRRDDPMVLAADASELSTAPSNPLDRGTTLGSPFSEETSKSLPESDVACYISLQSTSDYDSEYDEDDDDEYDDGQGAFTFDTRHERAAIKGQAGADNNRMRVFGIEIMDRRFGAAIRDYLYKENAFPSKNDDACIHLCKRVLRIPQEEEIGATDQLQKRFNRSIFCNRSHVSHIINVIMKTYTFDTPTLPEVCKSSRKRQMKYMVDAMRFARKDYLSAGAILQSAALGDVIAKGFYATGGVGLCFQTPEDQVPRPVIALAFVFMYIHMGKLCRGKRDQRPLNNRRASVFRASLYHNTLHGAYENGEKVDWDEVQRVQTEHVRQKLRYQGMCDVSPFSAAYQPKYQDGVYVSDSGED
ncbi:hypothetical protein O0I10_006723 [Lichtheimia ornata]|uniref:DUF6532 domain-containing protein n=1 Tax=Lichtheimia ornata TaxID=688661 RepID=A0AAD7V235_9FUNG|nr:uncharacterized protein O0I10_006723 [Lichtheimia ornata]KAJ8657657.1 hypothetical protein O0I10_006723 [Lichtheimia ornata]